MVYRKTNFFVLLGMLMLLINGCSVDVSSDVQKNTTISKLTQEIADLKIQITILENNKEQLDNQIKDLIAEIEQIERQNQEIYDLRNDLDLFARKFFISFVNNDYNALKEMVTDNIVITKDFLLIGGNFELNYYPPFTYVRQLAYTYKENEFMSIYEYYTETNDPTLLFSLSFVDLYFVKVNNEWKIDRIDTDI